MIEAFTLKSRGKDMVCLLEYKDPSVRGKKVVLYKHGFFGNKITPHRIMVSASHELQEEGYTICRFDCVGAGDSEGDSHYTTIYGEIEDTKVVLHWIKENIKPEKFMILGYSMGGIVTSVLCNEVPLDGILLWSPCSEPYANFHHLLGADLFDRGLKGEDFLLLSTAHNQTAWNRTVLPALPEGCNHTLSLSRSEERRVGKECNLSCRSRWSPYH